jgi:pyruvate,orthophosphate dikinase
MKSIVLSSGLITIKGGATSHAAIVARGRNMVCILALKNLEILQNGIKIENVFLENRTLVTLDGNRGYLFEGIVDTEEAIGNTESTKWKLSDIQVKVNGETVLDMENGHKFLMDGVGLCRIEHMLLTEHGNSLFSEFLLNEQNKNLEIELEKYLSNCFKDLFIALKNLPITIRLLDPPLHEFLPIDKLKEVNPMMGNRGARLLINNNCILALQIRGIFNAYIFTKSKSILEIMIPFVFSIEEIVYIKRVIKEIHTNEFSSIEYKFGVMIELPRAVFIADLISKEVDFISFGTNDLTQMTFGLSRDDSGSIIQHYMEKGIMHFDPFQKLDNIVEELLKIAVQKARSIKPHIIIGICGEQGANEETVEFLSFIGINYISCSPFSVEQVRFCLNCYVAKKQME